METDDDEIETITTIERHKFGEIELQEVERDGVLLSRLGVTVDSKGQWVGRTIDEDGDGTNDFVDTRTYLLDHYGRGVHVVIERDGQPFSRADFELLGTLDEVDLPPTIEGADFGW